LNSVSAYSTEKILGKQIIPQLVRKFYALSESRRLISIFTSPRKALQIKMIGVIKINILLFM
jgi:hypothetical protein